MNQKEPKPNLKLLPPNQALYKANLEVMGPEFSKIMETVPDVDVPIDDDVKIQGLVNPTYLVIIGFSGTKVFEAAKATRKNISHTLIIEPDLRVFAQALRRNWIGELAKSESVDLLIGIHPEEMLPHIHRIFTQSDAKLGNRASRSLQPEIVVDPFVYRDKDGKQNPVAEQITKIVIDASKQVLLSMGCASDSYYRMEQLIRNETYLSTTYRISPLFNKFSDIPVIVLGAGPSLRDFINASLEHKLHERCLIIACDAALKLLLDHNIKPHIVTRCERKKTTIFNSVKKEDTKGLFYAAYPWCPPEYFDLFEESFMLFRGNGVCKFSGFDPGEVNGGVSSANAALELAFLLGARHITLSGVDLCFLDGRSHIEGTEVEFDVEKSKPKWTEIPGNSGNMVTTIPVWYRCLNEYRTTLNKYIGQSKVFNTSVNGAKIEGTKVISWDELGPQLAHDYKASPNPISVLRAHIEKHPVGYADAFTNKKKETVTYFKQALNDLEKLFGNVNDCLLIGAREEQRVFNQLKSYVDPHEFYTNVASIKKSLNNVFQEPARQIDAFKLKYFNNESFSYCVMDTLQADYFQLENRLNGIKNTVEVDHERLKVYIVLNLNFLRSVEYFLKQFIELFTKGPNQKVDYEKILETYEV